MDNYTYDQEDDNFGYLVLVICIGFIILIIGFVFLVIFLAKDTSHEELCYNNNLNYMPIRDYQTGEIQTEYCYVGLDYWWIHNEKLEKVIVQKTGETK